MYPPERWADEAILEEHQFTLELAAQEIPVVAPIVDANGKTLHEHAGFRFALFPSHGGRAPDLDNPEHLEWMGRFVGRIHSDKPFLHRPQLTVQRFAVDTAKFLLEHHFIPESLRKNYTKVIDELLQGIHAAYDRAGKLSMIRLHGDCHPGNILWTDAGPHFVDFDDTLMGPAIQDLWMWVSGDRGEMALQMSTIIEGYEDFREFNRRELHLVESLRSLRLIHYAAWLARRWQDPAFPLNFPWFNSERYWEEHILTLKEQILAVDQPPLSI
jgi:Ser/Thr protein kinase RdoA (MazF antagonist)